MLKHITIILPHSYRGGSLRVTKTIARMLRKGSADDGRQCVVRIAVLANKYDIARDFKDVIDDGIEIREFDWITLDPREAETVMQITGRDFVATEKKYQAPEDGLRDLYDTDLWFFVSDRIDLPLLPIKPYVVFATDYLQRYVPEIFPDGPGEIDLQFLRAARNAIGVVTTTPQTRLDAISYAGVPGANVHLAPLDFDPTWIPEAGASVVAVPYIVWVTNPTQHKNHLRALDALDRYYAEGGKLKVHVTGPNTHWFLPSIQIPDYIGAIEHVAETRKRMQRPNLRQNVTVLGEIDDERYAAELSGAAFMWHPTLYDNGTFAVVEAAYCGCPTLSSGYPQMRYIADRFSIPMEFFNARNVEGMVRALKAMETRVVELRSELPSREQLAEHSWQRYAGEYWATIEKIYSGNLVG